MDKEVKEVLEWEKLICDFVNKGSYLSAYILLGERLRSKAKEDSLVEDKRTETLN